MKVSDVGARFNAAPEAPKSKKDLGQDEFLVLLTTQLANQDPLSPADSQDFVAQLSQFASLEQLKGMTTSMQDIALSQTANTSAQMVTLIGKSIMIPTDKVDLGANGPTHEFGFQLADRASSITVSIRDANGKVVREIDMGGKDAGKHSIEWDGLDENGLPTDSGEYSVYIEAEDVDGNAVQTQPYSWRRVRGVSFDGGSPRLQYGAEGEVGLGSIVQVRENSM
jgi:flagellar basal-body rod modification protein FlgD